MKSGKNWKQLVGISFLFLFAFMALIEHFFFPDFPNQMYSFTSAIVLIAGVVLVIPFEYFRYFFWDNREYEPNKTIPELIRKLRFRATLFNNISIAVLLLNILVL